MKVVTRMASFPFLAVLLVSCTTDPASAPLPNLALKHQDTGNPDCQLPTPRARDQRSPVEFLCAIEIPGPNPLTSSQKGWVEQSNAKYFLSDASNFGVDVLDIRTHTFVGRVGGMAGNVGTGG